MILDLSEELKDKRHIVITSMHETIKTNIIFIDENFDRHPFNIKVGRFIIELEKSINNIFDIYVWVVGDVSTILEKKNIKFIDLKQEVLNTISYCEKYINLMVFS